MINKSAQSFLDLPKMIVTVTVLPVMYVLVVLYVFCCIFDGATAICRWHTDQFRVRNPQACRQFMAFIRSFMSGSNTRCVWIIIDDTRGAFPQRACSFGCESRRRPCESGIHKHRIYSTSAGFRKRCNNRIYSLMLYYNILDEGQTIIHTQIQQ